MHIPIRMKLPKVNTIVVSHMHVAVRFEVECDIAWKFIFISLQFTKVIHWLLKSEGISTQKHNKYLSFFFFFIDSKWSFFAIFFFSLFLLRLQIVHVYLIQNYINALKTSFVWPINYIFIILFWNKISLSTFHYGNNY